MLQPNNYEQKIFSGSDDFDGDRESTYQEIFNESRITGSNMEELSKLTKDSKKSSHVPFTNQCISKETELEHSKRTNSTIPDGTQSVFINTLPSYRSQKPTYPWTSSGSSINSASSNFHSGILIDGFLLVTLLTVLDI